MKKKIVSIVLASMFVMSTIVGCGEGKEEQVVENFPTDIGLSQEELDSVTEDLEEFGILDSEESAEPNANDFELYEASDEIANLKLEDSAIQIADVILMYDGSMTLSNVMDSFDNTTDADQLTFIDSMEDTEINPDGLIEGGDQVRVVVCYGGDVTETLCYLTIYNTTDDMISIGDATLISVEPGFGDYTVNAFLPGAVRATRLSDYQDSSFYDQLDASTFLTYDTIAQYLSEQGYENVPLEEMEIGSDEGYRVTCEDTIGNVTVTHKYFFILDLDTQEIRFGASTFTE